MTEPAGFLICAFDPGRTTGYAQMIVSRRQLKVDGWMKALQFGLARAGWYYGCEVDCQDETQGAKACVSLASLAAESAAVLSNGRVSRVTDFVVESFIPRERTQDESLLAPVRLASAIQQELSNRRPAQGEDWPDIVWQSPSEAKSVVTDDRLKRWGLWRVGSTHVRDANRHLALRLRALAEEVRRD